MPFGRTSAQRHRGEWQPPPSRATIQQYHLDGGSSTDVNTVYPTNTVTPHSRRLQLLTVVNEAGSPDAISSVTGCGLTWVAITNLLSGTARMTLYSALGSSPVAGSVSVTYPGNQTGFWWSLDEFDGVLQNSPIRQSQTSGGSSGSGVAKTTLPNPIANPANLIVGAAVVNNVASVLTYASGYSEVFKTTTTSTVFSVESGFTNKTVTGWTYTPTAAFGSAAIEVEAAILLPSQVQRVRSVAQAINRAGTY